GSASVPFLLALCCQATKLSDYGIVAWNPTSSLPVDQVRKLLQDSKTNTSQKMFACCGFQLDWSDFPAVEIRNVGGENVGKLQTKSTSGVAAGGANRPGEMILEHDVALMINETRVTMVATWKGRHPDEAVL
ncbi:unnamed protein product, partial [Amoebophrya sp. A25]